jgi:lipase chaperone LimK
MRARRLALTMGAAGVVLATALIVAGVRGVPSPASLAATPMPLSAAAPPATTSLAGTTPDGAATAAPDHALVLDPALIRLFDYYLTTVGERPVEAIRAQVEQDLDGRLGPLAAKQAKDVFARYLQFKTALKARRPARVASGRSVDLLREGLRTMLALRATFFSDVEAQALFAPQDAEASAALVRMAIEQDPALTDAQRRDKLAALDASLPADVRAAREAPLAVIHLQDAAERLRAQGASEDDVYRMRAAAVSPEAANRLADLDRDEASWKARIAAYQAQRSGILSAPGNDETRQEAIAELRAKMFTPEEQRRLAAYEG